MKQLLLIESATKHGQLSSIKVKHPSNPKGLLGCFILSGKSYALLHVYAAYLRKASYLTLLQGTKKVPSKKIYLEQILVVLHFQIFIA